MSKYNPDSDTFIDADGVSFTERNVCNHCRDSAERQGTPFAWGDVRYSFGCYAGRYCDACWAESGFRDATDRSARFDPEYAGERMDEDE